MSYTYTAIIQYQDSDGRFANLTNTATITAYDLAGNSISSPSLTNIATGVYKASVTQDDLEDVIFRVVPHVDDQTDFADVCVMQDKIVHDLAIVDGNVDDIETILGTPANFKADVSALALEATLTAIKGGEWSDETLVAIKTVLDAISPLDAAGIRTAIGLASANVDTQLGAMQADLDNPDQYKADVSTLALEATLTAMKGAGWTTETLKALADAIDAIDAGSGESAETIWGYVSRTLTMTATEISESVSGSSITQVRGNSWGFDIPNVTLYTHKQQFAIKKNSGDTDEEALLFMDSVDGLLVLNGVAITDPDDRELASLVYTDATNKARVEVDPSISAQLAAKEREWGLQSVNDDGAVSEHYIGVFNITADIVRASE